MHVLGIAIVAVENYAKDLVLKIAMAIVPRFVLTYVQRLARMSVLGSVKILVQVLVVVAAHQLALTYVKQLVKQIAMLGAIRHAKLDVYPHLGIRHRDFI